MDDDVAYHLGLVCEGPEDARTVRRLVERILTRQITWMQNQFDDLVGWQGVERHTDYTTWSGPEGIKQLAKSNGFRFHGRFSGLEG